MKGGYAGAFEPGQFLPRVWTYAMALRAVARAAQVPQFMKLYENEAKDILREMGVLVPYGEIARSPGEARRIAERIAMPVALKARVLVGGRGKAGGVRFADSPEEAEDTAKELLETEVKGLRPSSLLVEQKQTIERELYLGMAVDRSRAMITAVASSRGGVDIEEVAREAPEDICTLTVDVGKGLRGFEARRLAKGMGLGSKVLQTGTDLALTLYRTLTRYDATTVELNPVALTREGKLVAVDAVIAVDDDALYRQPDIRAMAAKEPRATELEVEAAKSGFSFVELDGDIGIIGNGAGITMATLDLVSFYGGRPANFLDIGGGVAPETMKKAVEIGLSVPRSKVLMINVFAGINRCDDVASGIVAALNARGSKVPLVVRLMGTNEVTGREILKEAGLNALEDLEEAVQKAVQLARESA